MNQGYEYEAPVYGNDPEPTFTGGREIAVFIIFVIIVLAIANGVESAWRRDA